MLPGPPWLTVRMRGSIPRGGAIDLRSRHGLSKAVAESRFVPESQLGPTDPADTGQELSGASDWGEPAGSLGFLNPMTPPPSPTRVVDSQARHSALAPEPHVAPG